MRNLPNGDFNKGALLDKAEFKSFPEVSITEIMWWLEERGMTIARDGLSVTRRFNWVTVYPSESSAGSMIDSSKVLTVCDALELPNAISNCPYGFFLVVAKKVERTRSGDEKSKCAFVEAEDKASVEREVLTLFQKNMIWETKLDYLVFRESRLESLIEAGEMAFRGAFLCITDTGFNLIACSHSIEPPSSAYKELVQTGSYCGQEAERLKALVLKSKIKREVFYCPPTEWNESVSVHCPLFINGEYTFHVTMVDSPNANLACLEDRFMKFVSRVRFTAERFWSKKLPVKSACHKILISVIEGERRSRASIEEQLEQSGIPIGALYRLMAIPLKNDVSKSFMDRLRLAVDGLNKGRNHAFVYKSNLLVLFYGSKEFPRESSLTGIVQQYDECVYGECSLEAGVSQVFDDIKDIKWAYIQCGEAIKHKGAMKQAYPAGYTAFTKNAWPCFPFDHALFLMVYEKGIDEELLSFSFENNLLGRFAGDDNALRRTVLGLLWRYICNDGNATKTAEEMHMHRNTVLYHVRKFESRFDLSLDSPMVKHRVMADCLHYMAQEAIC